mgnify:CR=1 FL=1
MAQFVKLNPEALQPLREVDARLVSYDYFLLGTL